MNRLSTTKAVKMNMMYSPEDSPNPVMETQEMTCATSLPEEFEQYKTELNALSVKIATATQTSSDPILAVTLTDIKQTLEALNTFNTETESASAIHYMATRATDLIDRVTFQCTQLNT